MAAKSEPPNGPLLVTDFFSGEQVPLNDMVGVRALHMQRSKVFDIQTQKLQAKQGSTKRRLKPLDGDPNPNILLGDYETVAEVYLLRHKFEKELHDARQREEDREATRRKLVSREFPMWRRKNMIQQFRKEHEAAEQDIKQLERDQERMLAAKLVEVNLLK